METIVVMVANARILELHYVGRTVCYCGLEHVLRLDDVMNDASTCCSVAQERLMNDNIRIDCNKYRDRS